MTALSDGTDFAYLFEGLDGLDAPPSSCSEPGLQAGEASSASARRSSCRWLEALQRRKQDGSGGDATLEPPGKPQLKDAATTAGLRGKEDRLGVLQVRPQPPPQQQLHGPGRAAPAVAEHRQEDSARSGSARGVTKGATDSPTQGGAPAVRAARPRFAPLRGSQEAAPPAVPASVSSEQKSVRGALLQTKPSLFERRRNPEDGRVYEYGLFHSHCAETYSEAEILQFWMGACVPCQYVPERRRVLVLRHGSRPYVGADPALDSLGREQAGQAALHLASELGGRADSASQVTSLFCSPFTRALETAAPLAKALRLPVLVEWGFSELLAHGWLHTENPLPGLRARQMHKLPASELMDKTYATAVVPAYPDVNGRLLAGDGASRRKALDRHREAVHAALDKAGGKSLVIVGHGSTHDFVTEALCPEHPLVWQTPACVPNCAITEIVEEEDGRWRALCFGSELWTLPSKERDLD